VISDGNGFTETVTPLVDVQPAVLVATTLYTLLPVAVGNIEGAAHEEHESPAAPAILVHANVAPGAAAVNVAEVP
jgi:hypothetical protein